MSKKAASLSEDMLSAEQVVRYLERHPEFLREHPALLDVLAPPERAFGEGVADFQHFQLKSLQQNAKALQGKYAGLVDFCRDNLSAQAQVHAAVLRLIRARSLEQLLEALTQDLMALFDLDVVRLVVESEAAAFYDTYYGERNYSGIVFVEPGLMDMVLGGRQALLLTDAAPGQFPGFEKIFADCQGLVRSCALLQIKAETVGCNVLLAFGVRHSGRFHPGQAIDLLSFMAEVLAYQLDRYLSDFAGEAEGAGDCR
jgi:uncharacterized protein YigA (DUF484 family)